MVVRRAAAVRAATSILILLSLASGNVWAAPSEPTQEEATVLDEEAILGDDEESGWSVSDLALRTTLYIQNGEGYQSQAGPLEGPGSEDTWIGRPEIKVGLRQSPNIQHDIFLSMDVVTAASPDALDLVTAASRVNEGTTLDINSSFRSDATTTYTTRVGGHHEEQFASFFCGAGYVGELYDANTVVSFNANLTMDGFDDLTIRGRDLGYLSRGNVNVNAGLTQVLSPTTLFDGSLGFTYQFGTLQNTWNSVPYATGDATSPTRRTNEVFPTRRFRFAARGRLSQHIPAIKGTAKAGYRFYVDSFDVKGHTLDVAYYQYLVEYLFVRASYRLYQQNAVDFFAPIVGADIPKYRTADSDLAALWGHEWGLKLVLLHSLIPPRDDHDDTIDVGIYRYQRTNGLSINYISLGYARKF